MTNISKVLMKIKIPWWEPQTGPKEKIFLQKVLDSNFPNEGDLTYLFEKKIAKLLKIKYVVTLPNCTSAIFLVLKGLGIGKGDEVIVPDLCFIAAPNAVDLTGATPVLVDIDPSTLNINPESFRKAITKKTRAVIPVHVSGRACDMEEIIKIAKDHNIFVVEDAAEAFLSKHRGKFLGTFGNAGCFSFSPAKTITTGQGGAVVTNDQNLYLRLKELKDQGRPKRGTGGDDLHNIIGYNFKFTNLQAAFGLGQLYYLKKRIARMKRNHQLYLKNLRDLKEITIFECDLKNGELPQWTDCLVHEKRNQLVDYLLKNNIDSRRFWFPIHTQKPFKDSDRNFPNSTKLSPKALWLPSAFTLTDTDINGVCHHIRRFFQK